MVQQNVIHGAELKREADKNKALLLLTYYSAHRQRNRLSTDIKQMRKNILAEEPGLEIDPQEWLEAFKKLESLGMGSLIIGRGGKATRFKWNYSLKAIGKAAINGIDIHAKPITPRIKGNKHVNTYHATGLPPTQPNGLKSPVKEANTRSIKHVIYVSIRPDYVFEAELPDLTKDEAERICAAIKRCA